MADNGGFASGSPPLDDHSSESGKLSAEGLRYCEIAGVMQLSISTVVDAVRRATVKLAREFDTKVSL